jgi:hypothetical protein
VTPGINGWMASTAASVARSGRSWRRSILARCWRFKVGRRKFTDGRAVIHFCWRAYSSNRACCVRLPQGPLTIL